MKAIEEKMKKAFDAGRNWHESNTEVCAENGNVFVYLWGNLICTKINGEVKYFTCGWNTPTTRNRLNALGANCRIKNGLIIFE